MDWPSELRVMLETSQGDLALFCGLVALRKAENGDTHPFGVLSVARPPWLGTEPGDVFVWEADIARNSLRNHTLRFETQYHERPFDVAGYYTDHFLEDFSHRWSPTGAANDPQGLNQHHKKNLLAYYHAAKAGVRDTLTRLVVG